MSNHIEHNKFIARTVYRYKVTSMTMFILMMVTLASGETPVLPAQGLMGGGEVKSSTQCISPDEHKLVDQAIDDYIRQFGPLTTSSSVAGVPEKFTFYPMGGTLYRDIITINFNDLDTGPGILDWDCTDYTYDGHDATDVILRSFGEQAIGVPIFAALDGTVIAAHDGEFDMNSIWCANIPPPYPVANYVILNHLGGRRTYYWHMKINSVLVSVGQEVLAGEQIGDIGSSGCSTDPHIHFATYDGNGAARVEPYTGSCNPGTSSWVNQTPIERNFYLHDFNISDQSLSPGMPFHQPRAGTFVMGNNSIYMWLRMANQPGNSAWRIRFRRPDGSIPIDTGTQFFNNPFYRWSWWWWGFGVNMDMVGTWHLLFDLGTTTIVEAPFEVVATSGDVINRAPNPVTVQLEPLNPVVEDVLICRVNTDLILNDLDYDIVQYHYVWKVDNVVVRDVTTAAYSDVIPHYSAPIGSTVECVVTPTDGIDAAIPATDSVVILKVSFQPPDPVLPDPDSPGGFACGGGPNYGLPCSTCSVGMRAGEICTSSEGYTNDCGGEPCVPTDALCGEGYTCGSNVAAEHVINIPWPKNRYIGFMPPVTWFGTEIAIRVTLVDVPSNPNCNGEIRWAGMPAEYSESAGSEVKFQASKLVAAPVFVDWNAIGNPIQIYGEEINPVSLYSIQAIDIASSSALDVESNYSNGLLVKTAVWGDVIKPLSAFSNSVEPSVDDVLALVGKWLGKSEPLKAISHLQPAVLTPANDLTVDDVLIGVNAWLGSPYPFSVSSCP